MKELAGILASAMVGVGTLALLAFCLGVGVTVGVFWLVYERLAEWIECSPKS